MKTAGMITLAPVALLALACTTTNGAPDAGEHNNSSGGADAGGDAGAPDAGEHDAGPTIVAEDLRWTWVPVAESRCMDGSSTGLAVNLSSTSDKVMIQLEGGFACFSPESCAEVFHPNGFDENTFLDVFGGINRRFYGVLDRDNADNPFKDWNHVFIPYCSGDLHAGNVENGYGGRMQVGYRNLGHFLARLLPDFRDASLVVLTGWSAGGYGSILNYDRVQEAFGNVPVYLLPDSSPPMSTTYIKPCFSTYLHDLWNIGAILPAGCTDCGSDDWGIALMRHNAAAHPERRVGIISSVGDTTIRDYYGVSSDCQYADPMSEAEYSAGLGELRQLMSAYANFKTYYIPGTRHVFILDDPLGSVSVNGTTLTDWLRDFIDPAQPFMHVPQ